MYGQLFLKKFKLYFLDYTSRLTHYFPSIRMAKLR